MEVVNHKLITFQIYQQIIQDCLSEAQKYARHQLTKELSNQYLKVIDELIQIINDKHKQDFLLDRIHSGNPYSFRSIYFDVKEASDDEF